MEYVSQLPTPDDLRESSDLEQEMLSLEQNYLAAQEELGPEIFCLPKFFATRFTRYIDFGYESYLSALALYPGSLQRLFEHDAEQARQKTEALAELVRQGKMEPFFLAGSDICGTRGPMVSPEMLRRLYLPSLQRSIEPLVAMNADLIWHSDGYILPIIDDLIGCGITGFQGFQEDTGFDIRDIAVKQSRKRRRPILLAGLSITGVLPHGTERDTQREVERIIDSVGAAGGLAIATANTAGPDCRPQNLSRRLPPSSWLSSINTTFKSWLPWIHSLFNKVCLLEPSAQSRVSLRGLGSWQLWARAGWVFLPCGWWQHG